MIFFKGGMGYSDLMTMPLPEIQEWVKVANRISREDEQELKRKG